MLESLFNKVAGLKDCNFIKERLQHRCFSVNNAKFLRTHFLQNTSGGCFYMWHGPTLHQYSSCAMLSELYLDNVVRSNRLQMFLKISVFKNFSNFTLKHLWWISFE